MNRKSIRSIIAFFAIMVSFSVPGQNYSFDDFVGTWHGNISSQSSGGYNDPITMTIEADGFYTETSGHLMPSLYPNTQQCEYQTSTNRMHWWYISTAWGGQYFYDHHFYEVVYFQNDTLEMHYNYWDDPAPLPEVGTIFLVKESSTPPPTALAFEVVENDVSLSWDPPANGSGGAVNPDSYNVYYKFENDSYELIGTTGTTQFVHENVTVAGMHHYYVTAVYNEGESNPSNAAALTLTTPEPTGLTGQLLANNVALFWTVPEDADGSMAQLLGYNVFYSYDNGSFELLMFVATNNYAHQNIDPGLHKYYVTAVYDGGESDPSNQVEVELLISGIEDKPGQTVRVFPNPVTDIVYVQAEFPIHSVVLFDQAGNLIRDHSTYGEEMMLDVNNLKPGFYTLRIETKEKIISKRIMVN